MGEPLLTWSPPQAFDEFELLGPLGRGGMGRVFLARDAQLERKVALKFIAEDKPDDDARLRFGAEARAIARLSHPNVVSVYRIGEVEERPFIAYELVVGQALDELPLPVHWTTLLPIAVGIVSGLAAAHREGLVHGDVKPANVVLSLEGVPKLLDFGLARLHEPEPPSDWGAVVWRVVAGTPAYMAPEVLEGQRPGPRADVFALGLLLRDLLTGDKTRHHLPPHKLAQLLRLGLPPASSACQELPSAFGRVIDRCLRPRPEQRYEDAAVLFAELAPLCEVLVSSPGASAAVITPDAVLLSECLGRIWERIDTFTEDLYSRLFGAYPELRALFPENMRGQRAKLAHALKLTVEGLRTPERLRSSLVELGRRHASYGVAETELSRLGPVLLAALRDADQSHWGEELEAAWLRGWHLILESMRLGYSQREGAPWSGAHSVAPPTDVTVEPGALPLPRVRYASSGEAQLAWHDFGEGALSVVMLPPWMSHLEMPWRQREYAAFLRGMGRLGRCIRYDRRGAGLSDREAAKHDSDHLADLLSVLDAAAVKRAVVFAPFDAARLGLELSVAHPARVRALVLYGTTLQATREAESPFGTKAEILEARVASLGASWGEEALLDVMAPSRRKDAAFRRFWGEYMRMALTPRQAVRELERAHALDLHALAARCRVPALVLHRTGDHNVPIADGRALASQLDQGIFVELPGEDHLPFLGDSSTLLRAIERFMRSL